MTRYGYDALGQLIEVIENYQDGAPPAAQTNVRTQYGYDAIGSRTVITDARGGVTAFAYDELSRLTLTLDPLEQSTHYGYDALGRRTVITDANGEITTFTYDPLGRPLRINYTADGTSVAFAYDLAGRRTAMTDTLGLTRDSYDPLSWLAQVIQPGGETITYTYDLAGNRSGLDVGGGRAVAYSYDAANRLLGVEDWASQVYTYTYDAWGRLAGVAYPNGVTAEQRYDAAGRLVGASQRAPDSSLQADYALLLDGVGNRTLVTETLRTPGITGTLVTTNIGYSYDDLGRLTGADYSVGDDYAYSYDASGNRLSQVRGQETITYTYDLANRLTSVNGQTYTWDAAGNLLDDGDKSYSYDQAKRLVGVSGNGLAWSAGYNGDGARLRQSANGVVVSYTLDLAAPLATVLGEQRAGGSRRYLYGQGDSPLAADESAAWTYLSGRDPLHSVRQETAAQGQLLGERRFDPYGVPVVGDGGTPFGYTGEAWDAETGVLYLRARYLQPQTGRFVSKDVWPGNDRIPLSRNAWVYGFDDPISNTDPSGKRPLEESDSQEGNDQAVIGYIVDRIREDSQSKEIGEIRELNSTQHYANACTAYQGMRWWERLFASHLLRAAQDADSMAQNLALEKFGCLVADASLRPIGCGTWDYKVEIGGKYQNSQRISFASLGIDEAETFYYDIWANVHFGYLGMVGGFSEGTLLIGAAIENAGSALFRGRVPIPRDDASDTVANRIGIEMYKAGILSPDALLQQVYLYKGQLNKARFVNGVFQVYQ